jgi:hypothetical protein
MTLEASGQSHDAYFIVTYKNQDGASFVATRKLIESLLDRMSIEIVQ